MRVVALILALLVAGFVIGAAARFATWRSENRHRRLRQRAQWQVRHYSQGGNTLVVTSLTTSDGHVVDEHVVAEFPDIAPDWDIQFLRASMEARQRAFHLTTNDGITPS